eukprot:Skav205146  [mRNA]  locus=scaffold593:76465:77486:- [translate_table: standard]
MAPVPHAPLGLRCCLSSEGGKPWDYAAGTIIAKEAGAKFCNLKGTGGSWQLVAAAAAAAAFVRALCPWTTEKPPVFCPLFYAVLSGS